MVTTHFSQDPYYYAANFGMVGKAPYYEEATGVLMLDDIYLMAASVSPLAKDVMKEAFNTSWNGKNFVEQWLENPDVIKDALKATVRALHKILVLGISYSMGPKKMVKTAYEAGYTLSKKDATAFYNAYWDLFKRVRMLDNVLKSRFKKQGYLVNPFGYRLTPDSDHKVLNQFIQSSVSGIMHALAMFHQELFPPDIFVTCIHDEVIYETPEHLVEESKAAWQQAVNKLNEQLKWSVNIRSGYKVGANWYTAH
jgi:DNA polymerase I-like protein with 3'-5' exonuclease and polymerase domains